MKTEKLYYLDSHLRQFTASVLACEVQEGGYAVILDATAFYPEGGGQASDTGSLGSVRVLSSKEEGEAVVHLCDGPLPVGTTVTGILDWEPRFDRMQQHSGEHIVSGIIHRLFGYHNVGFHMSSQRTVIDFDGVISQEALQEIELEANGAIWANIPLHIWTPSEEVLPTIPYRTKRALPWPVRIVEVPGFDICACCGTHVKATGEIGLVKLFSAIPCRGGTRIEMACGRLAYFSMDEYFRQNRQVSQLLSVPQGETAQGAAAVLNQLEALKMKAAALRRAQSQAIADGYAGAGDVVCFCENLNNTELRELTEKIMAVCGGRAAVLTGGPETFSYCLASREGSIQPLCKAVNAAFSGRGGGKPGFCQGSLTGDQDTICAYLKTAFSQG